MWGVNARAVTSSASTFVLLPTRGIRMAAVTAAAVSSLAAVAPVMAQASGADPCAELGAAGAMANELPSILVDDSPLGAPVGYGADVALVQRILAEVGDVHSLAGLIARFEDDPSYHYLAAAPELKQAVDAHLELLSGAVAYGEGAGKCAALTLVNLRETIVEGYAALPFYQVNFSGMGIELPDAPPPPDGFRLDLDFSAASTVLEVLGEPGLSVGEIGERLDDEVFDALVKHRNQDFYPIRLTSDMLARNVARAASDDPLDRLYRYAFPVGSMHYSEVRELLPRYRRLVADLEAAEGRIVASVAAKMTPYLPPDSRFERTVHFVFGDGADGWVAGGVAAVDLEFFKDDFDRLLPTLAHETFHAVQSEVRRPARSHSEPGTSELAGVFETIYQEGTANFVAPVRPVQSAEAMALATEGLEMLEQIRAALFAPTPDEGLVRDLLNRGVQGAGPFYWLGAEMARAIVVDVGPAGITRAMENGGVEFFALYLQAVRDGGDLPAFSPELVAAVRKLSSADSAGG